MTNFKLIMIGFNERLLNKKKALKLINISKYGKLTCEICKLNMRNNSKISQDHIVPKSRGGSNNISNIRLTHRGCNSDRGNNFLEDI